MVVTVAENEYKCAKNYCNRLVRRAKLKLFDVKINNNFHCPRKLWSALKELGVFPHNNSSEVTCSPEDLNNYFVSFNNSSVSENLVQEEINHVLENVLYPSFILQHVSPSQVAKALQRINTNAQGVDGLNKRMLVDCMPYCLPSLTHIINVSFSCNVFPDSWKLANVCPVPKVASPSIVNDYRPISLLPTLSKIIERLVSKQVVHYLNNLIPVNLAFVNPIILPQLY